MPRHRRKPSKTLIYPSAGIRHEGELTKHGYRIEESETKRHEALDKAIREDGAGKTVQRLNALAVVNKGNADKHRDLEMDVDYVHGQEYPKAIRDAYPKYQLQEYETVKRLHGKEHADSFFNGKYDRESPPELERIAREKGTIGPKAGSGADPPSSYAPEKISRQRAEEQLRYEQEREKMGLPLSVTDRRMKEQAERRLKMDDVESMRKSGYTQEGPEIEEYKVKGKTVRMVPVYQRVPRGITPKEPSEISPSENDADLRRQSSFGNPKPTYWTEYLRGREKGLTDRQARDQAYERTGETRPKD